MHTKTRFLWLRGRFKFDFHGIELSRVMSFELYSLAKCDYGGGWLDAFRAYDLFRLKFARERNVILSTIGGQKRKDHIAIYDNVLAKLGQGFCSRNDLADVSVKYVFRISVLLFALPRILIAMRLCQGVPWGQRIRFAFRCCLYCNSILELEKVDLNGVAGYLCMYNATMLENLITQYMKGKSIPTFSLCEGMYMVDDKNPSLDVINYANIETDHLLVWGQCVKDAFEKYGIDAKRMEVCGYPKDVVQIPVTGKGEFKRCLVLLARPASEKANQGLLKILAQQAKGIRYVMKPHPVSDREKLMSSLDRDRFSLVPQGMAVEECLRSREYDFAICVDSTTYYEALLMGVPCFQYDDGSYILRPDCGESFTSAETFDQALMNVGERIRSGEYQRDVDRVLRNCLGFGIDRYASVIRRELNVS